MSDADEGAAEGLVERLLAACTFAPAGTAVTCAVSGGADSLALLVLAARAGLAVTAVHVDHGLRDGSAAEAAVVAAAAARVGAAFRAESVTVGPGPNVEARAREARYAVLPPDALTGHTADDQAETVLLNLLRGSGVEGLAGMRAGPRRPLLALRRADTVALCRVLGLEPVHDPSNHDPAFRRNRVRHEVLPLLDDVAGRDVAALLARQADLFAEVADLLASSAGPVDATDAAALVAAPVPLARVAIRTWLRAAGVGDGYPSDAASVGRVLAVAHGAAVATELPGGWRVARTAGRLRIEPPVASPPRST
ncbi:MAG: tilS [Acidimicrobiales bacterium]|nr:tilS [Acidimicrobiales bacterium]